jgi:hypothetical protein
VTGTATTSEAADDLLAQPAERERRIRQFEHYLSMMQHRTLRLVKSDYVLFDLWNTPVEAWIKVEASAFEGSRRWEPGILMG